MPFDATIFKTRALTAVVFVIIMLVGLLWNQWSFIILFSIIHFGCWHEFIKLIKKIYFHKYVYYLPAGLLYITLPVLMLLDLAYPSTHFDVISAKFFPIIPCGIIFSIWINDTMAYLIGSLVGKTPLSKISPKKTWEGTVGGILLCVFLIGYLVAGVAYKNLAAVITHLKIPLNWYIIAAICAVFGTLGDLLESKFKRMANVKDSGQIMPGHGGFLDRFDSLLVATPFVWLYIYLFLNSK